MNRQILKITLLFCFVVMVGNLNHLSVVAQGPIIIVNGTGDLSDINPGDGLCDTLGAFAGQQCGLRAAIEEINALGSQTLPFAINFNLTGSMLAKKLTLFESPQT